MLKSFVQHNRPYAVFDAKNAEHRDLYYKFLHSASWKHCPYQWLIDDDSADVVYYIQKKLIDYYMDIEFKTVAKKPQKSRKSTDKNVFKINDIKTRKKATK
jgi:hypothetical protein